MDTTFFRSNAAACRMTFQLFSLQYFFLHFLWIDYYVLAFSLWRTFVELPLLWCHIWDVGLLRFCFLFYLCSWSLLILLSVVGDEPMARSHSLDLEIRYEICEKFAKKCESIRFTARFHPFSIHYFAWLMIRKDLPQFSFLTALSKRNATRGWKISLSEIYFLLNANEILFNVFVLKEKFL